MEYSNLPSNRHFGFFFSAVFAVIVLYLFYVGTSKGWLVIWGAISLLVALVAVFFPQVLSPFNRAWFRLGYFMSLIMNPLVLGAIFFVFLTPFAIFGRLIGRDELGLKKKSANSYWLDRPPNAPASDSFKNQF